MKLASPKVIGACVVVGLLFTLTSAVGVNAQGSEPIIIGAAIARTGGLSPYDGSVAKGAQVAIAKYNKRGGVLGRQLKIIFSDTKSEIPIAQIAAAEVISKGADVVLTTCDYDYGGPAARFANSKGLLAIGCAGAPEYGAKGIGPLTFNTYAGAPNEAAVHATFAYNVKKWRRAFVLCDSSIEAMKATCRYFKQSWKVFGGSICGEDTFVQTDPTIATQVGRIRNAASNCDFVLIASYGTGGPNAIRQIRAAGIDLPLELGASFDGDDWLNVVPTLSNAFVPAYASFYGDDPRPAVNKFFKDYQKANGGKPAFQALAAVLGHATVDLVVAGIKKSKTTDGKKLAAAFDKFKGVPTLIGPYSYSRNCHRSAPKSLTIIEYRNGKARYTGRIVNPSPKYIAKSIC